MWVTTSSSTFDAWNPRGRPHRYVQDGVADMRGQVQTRAAKLEANVNMTAMKRLYGGIPSRVQGLAVQKANEGRWALPYRHGWVLGDPSHEEKSKMDASPLQSQCSSQIRLLLRRAWHHPSHRPNDNV